MRNFFELLWKVIIPLFIGGMIYIVFRSESLNMFGWFKKIGIDQIIDLIGSHEIDIKELPKWIIFSLPDSLWIFSFLNLTFIIWEYQLTKQSIFWIIIVPLVAIMSEIGQAIKIVPGTYDLIDLILLIGFIILSFTLFNKRTLNQITI